MSNIYGRMLAAASDRTRRTVLEELTADPQVAAALRQKRRLARIELSRLAALPEGTLGRAFHQHMTANQISPEPLPRLPASDDLAYFRAHVRETHDLWHVVTGFAADVPGELGLQAFYLAQMPHHLAPLILAGGLLQAGTSALAQRNLRMREIVRGWLLGRAAAPLFGVPWDELWAVPIAEIQARYRLDRAAIDRVVDA